MSRGTARFPLAAGRFESSNGQAAWVLTGRAGGVSTGRFESLNLADHVGDDVDAVATNRDTAAAALGLGPGVLAVMAPVHGAHVAVVDRPGRYPGADALVTSTPGVGLLAMGADCVVVGLASRDGRTVAAVHCGWRGVVADVVGAAVAAMDGDVHSAVLGPAICGTCYRVPPERVDAVVRSCSAAVAAAGIRHVGGAELGIDVHGIDVRGAVRARLDELGVREVRRVGGCTAEDPGLFSYRREGSTGRQGLVVRTAET